MVDYEAGRKCSECGEVLRVDEFRYKNRRKDHRHLICFDCEPPGGFVTTLYQDDLKKEHESKKKLKEYNAGKEREVCKIDGDFHVVQEHFQMLASSCHDIALHLESMSKGNNQMARSGNAKKAAKKISEAIKLLS